jgi:hypothetical protein
MERYKSPSPARRDKLVRPLQLENCRGPPGTGQGYRGIDSK